MSYFEFINRLKRIDYLIRSQTTGTAAELVQKLQVSRRTIFNDLESLRIQGADIYYCRQRRSYCYKNDFSIKF